MIVVGLLLAPLFVWYFVLNNVAVYRSISVAPGTTVTQDFWVDYSGFYRLGIDGRQETSPSLRHKRGGNAAIAFYLWKITAPTSLIFPKSR